VALVAALLAGAMQHVLGAWVLGTSAGDIRWVRRYALAFVAKILVSVVLLVGYGLLVGVHNVAFMVGYGAAFVVVPVIEAWRSWNRQA
jgi:hypothetical protein